MGVLGFCADGGFAIKAAETEHRLKAVATVSMVDLGKLRREGLAGVLKPQLQQRLEEAGKQRTKESNGEAIKYVNYVFNTREEIPAGQQVCTRKDMNTTRRQEANILISLNLKGIKPL
jgi:hypothetical protein